jgi:hypothetical protein
MHFAYYLITRYFPNFVNINNINTPSTQHFNVILFSDKVLSSNIYEKARTVLITNGL